MKGSGNMKVTYAGAAILALLATACGETRSVKYFRDHPDEAREVKRKVRRQLAQEKRSLR